MAIRYGRGDVKQTTTGFREPLMVQSLTSAKSKFLSLKVVLDFHDREIVRLGASWLEGLLQGLRETIFIKELGENLDKNR